MIDLAPMPAAAFGGATRLRPLLARWQAAIAGPLPAARRIAVVSVEPGVGATTLTRHVARIASGARDGRVLAVDASPDGALAATWRLRADPPRARLPRTTGEATAHLASGPEGSHGLAPTDAARDAVGAWLAEAAPLTRFFDVAVTDFGARHPSTEVSSCAALGDTVLVVADARRAPAEAAVSLAAGIRALPEQPEVVVALVDMSRTAAEAPRVVAAHAAPLPVVTVSHDAALADDAPPRRLTTRAALLQLTAALVRGGER